MRSQRSTRLAVRLLIAALERDRDVLSEGLDMWRSRALVAERRVEMLREAAGCAEYALMTGAEGSRQEALALLQACAPPAVPEEKDAA